MDFDLYKKIIDEGSQKGLKSVKLNYGGEPLLYPQLPNAISYAKHKGILDVQINSNFLFFNEFLAKELMFTKLNLLIITDYDIKKQKENVKFFSELRMVLGFYYPRIRIKTNNPDDWKDIADEILPNTYYEYNLKEDFTPSDFKCTQPWQRFLVLADGTVCSCSCGLFIPNKILGNAWHFSLEELWNGKNMKFLRYCHEFGETHLLKQCRMCPARKEHVNKKKEE